MTVCIAALAADAKAIVCVADKAVTVGHSQWDTDTTKIVPLNPPSAVALLTGTSSRNDYLLRKIQEVNLNVSIDEMISILSSAASEVSGDILEYNFLRPLMLTKEDFKRSITSAQINGEIAALMKGMTAYKLGFHVLVCGFTNEQEPYLLDVSPMDIVANVARSGSNAIGSGASFARTRLLFAETKRSHPIERVLYDVFSAKAEAEMDVGVGYEWDAKIIIAGRPELEDVPKEIKETIEQVWSKYTRSPFEKRERDDLPSPPQDWKNKLQAYANQLY